MTVAQLIEKLKELPQDDYVATYNDIGWDSKDDPNQININKYVWVHNNYPYDKPDFEYWNLE